MFNFIHQPLTWAFLLVLVPLLIHLINMMRHRRVKWAAMEFLLASYKKHRKWIWLKQLALLLMRMAAIAAIVFIMAQWIPPDQWAKLFGGKVTHHYVLLDDSLSMTDRDGQTAAFDRAKQIVDQIIKNAHQSKNTQQRLTLIRYSRAAAAQGSSDAGDVADASNALVTEGSWREQFEVQLSAMEPSQLAVGPSAAMEMVGNLLAQQDDETAVTYVVSDFRQRDWENPAEIDQQFRRWETAGAQVNLVDCAASQHGNLAITYLAPVEGTRSAGVPLFVTVTVKNFGPEAADNVDLTLTSYAYGELQGDDPATIKPEPLDKRSEVIERIAPGGTEQRRIQVRFLLPGKHVVEARLPDDAIAADNVRYAVVDFPDGEPVLIVDGDPDQQNAYFLTAAFYPNDNDRTSMAGIQPEVETSASLRNMTRDELREKRAIYLLDVPRLDDAAIEKLETFVREGGGLAIFLGDNVNPTHYNERLYRGGEGLLPFALGEKEPLPPAPGTDERVPDFDVADHPVLEFLAAGNGLFLRGVRIGEYYAMADDWSASENPNIKILATLRDQPATPLIVEKPFGAGRVMAFNTTAQPLWNNWAREPSFVATMALAHGYLAAPLRVDESQLVGTPISVERSAEVYSEDAKVIVPAATPIARKPAAVKGELLTASGERKLPESAQPQTMRVSLDRSDQQGIYEIWTAKKTGELDVERYALNVDPDEGNLQRVSPAKLAEQLPKGMTFHGVGEMKSELSGQSSSRTSEYFLYLLIVLLIGEQLLAYSASYHPAPGGTR